MSKKKRPRKRAQEARSEEDLRAFLLALEFPEHIVDDALGAVRRMRARTPIPSEADIKRHAVDFAEVYARGIVRKPDGEKLSKSDDKKYRDWKERLAPAFESILLNIIASGLWQVLVYAATFVLHMADSDEELRKATAREAWVRSQLLPGDERYDLPSNLVDWVRSTVVEDVAADPVIHEFLREFSIVYDRKDPDRIFKFYKVGPGRYVLGVASEVFHTMREQSGI